MKTYRDFESKGQQIHIKKGDRSINLMILDAIFITTVLLQL